MSAQPLDARMARLEGAYEQINHRLGNVEDRLGRLEVKVDNLGERIEGRIDGKIDSLRSEIERRFAAVDQKFLWVIGLIVVSIIIPVAERFLGH